jgi:hypothetical protein
VGLGNEKRAHCQLDVVSQTLLARRFIFMFAVREGSTWETVGGGIRE